MAERILLEPALDSPTEYRWVTLDKTGKSTGDVHAGSLTGFAEHKSKKEIIFVLHGNDVLLRRVALPPGRNLSISKILPYLLEDELAEDIGGLHFESATISSGKDISVAVVRQEILRETLNSLTQQQIRPQLVMAESLLLPWQEDSCSILVEENRVCIRYAELQGCCIQPSLFEAFFKKLVSADEYQNLRTAQIWEQPDSNLASVVAGQGLEVTKLPFPKAGLLEIAELSRVSEKLNLTNNYRQQTASPVQAVRAWLPAASLLLVAFLLLLGDRLYSTRQLEQQSENITQATQQIFTAAFPRVSRVIDPLVQAQQLLDKGHESSKQVSNDFLYLLYHFGQQIQTGPQLQLGLLQYRNGRLSLRLQADSISTIEQLKTRLTAMDKLQVEIISTTSIDQGIDARLQIRRVL